MARHARVHVKRRGPKTKQQSGGYFVHPQAIVESTRIGRGTRIWAFAHVLPGAVLGEDCNICDHVFIENDVRVGNRVTVKCGVQLWDGVTLEDDVFVGPNATFTNDAFPRSRVRPAAFARTAVRRGASIGANATILPGVTVGARAMVGAGAVVTTDIPPHAVVVGNPAFIHDYIDTVHRRPRPARGDVRPRPGDKVAEVSLYKRPIVSDLRGRLTFGEVGNGLPFVPKRYFVLFDVPSRQVRGEHAHRALHQFLVCLRGECSLVVDNGTAREEIVLDKPSVGVHLPPMVWATQYKFSPDAVLLVLASAPYDGDDYIRSYDEYLGELGRPDKLRHRRERRKA